MRRLAAFLAAAMLVPGTTTAQSPSPEASPPMVGFDTRDVCVTITGPVTLLTGETLTQGIVDGTFTIQGLGTACGEASGPSVEPAADVPLGLVVGETALRVTREGDASMVALIINPNPSRVTATRMNMDLFDEDGGLVTTSSATVTVLPWQTTAVTASVDGAEGAKVLAVTLSKTPSEREGFDGPTAELTFSEVRTRQKDGFPTTTGRIQSSFESRWDLVTVTAVYRNRSGRIIGYAIGNIDSIPAKGRASFRIEGFEKLPKIGATEMYYQP